MGFSGGGSNVLKPHTHDGTVSQDGGALNMDNVTQASLTAGDLVYSDGVHLQRLAIGGSGQSLTSSGSAPQWSAASGAAWTVHASDTLTTAAHSITLSGFTIDSSYAMSIFSFSGSQGSASDWQITINGSTASNYEGRYFQTENGNAISIPANYTDSQWNISNQYNTTFANGEVRLYCTKDNNGTDIVHGSAMLYGTGSSYVGNLWRQVIWNSNESDITSITLDSGGTALNYETGTTCTLVSLNK